MKSSRMLIQDFQPVGNVGFPQNVFTSARYPLLGDFPNSTALYWYRPNASGMQTINGGVTLTAVGTLGTQNDYLDNLAQNTFNGTQRFTSTDAAFNMTGTFSIGFWAYRSNWNITSEEYSVGPAFLTRSSGSNGYQLLIYQGAISGWLNNAITPLYDCSEKTLTSGWHFFSWVRTVSSQRLYVDSVLVGTGGASSITSAGTFGLGDYSAGGQGLRNNTRIGDFVVHNGTEWTQSQVTSLYTAMLPNHTHTQQFAGHQFDLNELNTTSSEVLALYKANSTDILKDEKLTYTLTNNGAVVNENGIMGLDNAWRFNGSNYLTQTTLLDTTPDKGIVIDFWVKADNGRPSAGQFICGKFNVTGPNYSYFRFYLNTNGTLQLETLANSATSKLITSQTVLSAGGTPFYYVVLSWDIVHGIRLFINGILESQDSSATTMMVSGTNSDFVWGANADPAVSFNMKLAGVISDARVRNKIITQADVDIGYAQRYSRLQNNNLNTWTMNIRPSGIKTLEYQTSMPTVGQDATYSYRRGFTLGDGPRAGDQMLIKGGY